MMMMMKSSLPGLATDTTEITNFFIFIYFFAVITTFVSLD
jgi:hypothetical protein